MEVFGLVLMVYGIICIAIGVLKPIFVWDNIKFRMLQKWLGSTFRLQILIVVWGFLMIVIGVLIR